MRVESFQEARDLVYEDTEIYGWEDEDSYIVVKVDRELNDLVVFVDKLNGRVHGEYFMDIKDRFNKMWSVDV